MATLDWIIMIVFFLCLVGIVLWVVKRKKDDTSDYFLSGRSEIWMVVGQQIAMAHWEMQGWMILVLGWVFVPFYAHNKVFTMREFLLKYYN